MAYMSQELKKELAPEIKAVLKKYNMKGSIAVRHHSSLVVNVKSGVLDFIGDYDFGDYPKDNIDVNQYWLEEHYKGDQLSFLEELKEAMNVGNHDDSDIMTDYFDVGWYIDINIGQWDKPYIFNGDSK